MANDRRLSRYYVRSGSLFVMLWTTLLLLPIVADAEMLEEKLYAVDQLRTGFDTPLDEAEARCAELLEAYSEPADQGKIYFQLVQVLGQSGMRRPEALIAHIEKALQLPQPPPRVLRLYIYWGDTLQTAAFRTLRGEERVAARRNIVVPYLEGLKKALEHDLPEEPPELPPVDMFSVRRADTPEGREILRRLRRKHREQVAARRKAELQVQLIEYRDVLTSQIRLLYSQPPSAAAELEALARQILEDDAAVERLMRQVKEAGLNQSEQ